MNYEFTTDKVGSVKLKNFKHSAGNTFKIDGVNAQEPDANVVISGINQLLGIVNFQNQYDPEDTVRTVNQNVVESE